MKIFAIGAGKNIGYFSALHFLSSGHKVVFFLRSPGAFDNDATIQPYLKSGQASIVKGDALDKQAVENAWNAANKDSNVDLVLFTVGGTPVFKPTQGLVISPMDLTTRSLSNVLQSIASTRTQDSMPRMIVITSTGVTKASHDNLPFGFKWFYSYALHSPHVDKLGMERLLQYAMGKKWEEEVEPSEEVLPAGWQQHYPPTGWLPNIVIVRPAFLTDGESKATYKASTDEFASYTISRKDVAHFIGTRILPEWSTWSNKIVNIGN